MGCFGGWGELVSGSSGTSEYEPEFDEWEDVDYNDDASSKDQRKRKCNDAIERNDDDVLEAKDDVLEDELHNMENIETSDEEKFKRHKEVDAQRAAAEQNSKVTTTYGNASEYEEPDANLDTPPTTDEEDNMILSRRNKKKRVKIDEHIDYKKLKWKVGMTFGMTFGTIHKFKQAVIRFGLAQGYDLTFSESDSKRRTFGAACRSGCKFKLYASWDKRRATYVVKTMNNHYEHAKLQAVEDLVGKDNTSTSGATSMVDVEAVHFLSQTSAGSSYLPQPSRD
ncbi:hypothetical protein Cgig2_007818 [Carnegiea gigantea]|uniref:Transposase MuDR plant domain-containing protein n=1 Tax=Carnegiea gigantea TaxID=171969 RepID=A0A9Q1JIM4_9CARY|nr:hypothetical protein Cgig2_007818 [Carnegiea gigantea]